MNKQVIALYHRYKLIRFIGKKKKRWRQKHNNITGKRKRVPISNIIRELLRIIIKEDKISAKNLASIGACQICFLLALIAEKRFILINQDISNVIVSIMTKIILLVMVVIVVHGIMYQRNEGGKFTGCVLGIYLLVYGGSTLAQKIDKLQGYSSIQIIIRYSLFFVLAYGFFYVICKGINKKWNTIVVIIIYVIILFYSGIYFGAYNLLYFPEYYRDEVSLYNIYNNSNQIWKLFKLVIKVGITNLYVYPNKSILCLVSVFEYLVGKFTDLVLLGYIINKFKPRESE